MLPRWLESQREEEALILLSFAPDAAHAGYIGWNAYQYLNLDGVDPGHAAFSLRAARGRIRRVGPGCSIGPAGRRGFRRYLYQPTPAKWTGSLGDLVER